MEAKFCSENDPAGDDSMNGTVGIPNHLADAIERLVQVPLNYIVETKYLVVTKSMPLLLANLQVFEETFCI